MFGQQDFERHEIHGLDQVVLEAGGPRPLPVFLLTPAGQRHECTLLSGRCALGALGDFITIHARHSQVQEHQRRPKGFDRLECRWTVIGGLDVVPHDAQECGESRCSVAVVINDKNAAGGCIIAGDCGISGSVTIGDRVMLGGGAGMADHIQIGDGAQVGGRSAVMHDIPAGERWVGAPAMPTRDFFRQLSAVQALGKSRKGTRE